MGHTRYVELFPPESWVADAPPSEEPPHGSSRTITMLAISRPQKGFVKSYTLHTNVARIYSRGNITVTSFGHVPAAPANYPAVGASVKCGPKSANQVSPSSLSPQAAVL